MSVLSKPEFDDCVRYDELAILLSNFGATVEWSITSPVKQLESESDYPLIP